MSLTPLDCTQKCRSPQHAEAAVAALTAGSDVQLKAFLSSLCHNAGSLRDAFGRSALHMAASLGRRTLLDWLLDRKSADLTLKDKESGWTPLHRSAFYGHVHCLVALAKRGGLLSTQDKEGLSVLDLTMKDRPAHVVFKNSDPTEVYTWGNNNNFTLGHGNQESRQNPELLDVFARTGVYIKQVVLCEFHSVFLSQNGQVFTCGHGQGGRLGHGDQNTYLVPRMVEGLSSHHCSQVAAAKDHTVALTQEGYVYSFGLNTFHQLGLSPPPASAFVPKQVFSKALKGRRVVGVSAGRFHTVLWTREAVYTMGLNGGQLGYLLDPNGEKCVTAPRQVSALHHREVGVATAAASDGATVVVTERGDVYLLTEYQCKKMASRQLNIKKVVVSGGSLDHRVDPQILNEGGGEKAAILALDEAGRVFCWRSSGSAVRQCRWAYGRQVFVSDVALSESGMMFVTPDGESFGGTWSTDHKRSTDRKDHLSLDPSEPQFERIRLEKIPYVHRAVSVTADSKGRNFGVLQSDPKTSLYEIPSVSPSSFCQHFQTLLDEADESDSVHDVTLAAGDRTFPAHRYVLSTRSEFFRKLFLSEEGGGGGGGEEEENEEAAEEEVTRSEDAVGCVLLRFQKIPADMMEHALRFIYSDSCELLQHGARPRVPACTGGHNQDQDQDQEQDGLICRLQGLDLRTSSALDVYRSLPAKAHADGAKGKSAKAGRKNKGGRGDKGGANQAGSNQAGSNPVKALQAVAKKLGLGSLSARLEGVKYENGTVLISQKRTGNKPKFCRRKCSFLWDVTLRSEDGKEFPCHKSVLCARLEYFHSMLGNPWIEASSCKALQLPISSEILQVVLEYIYTDESPTIKECLSVEFVCGVLVVADQLLVPRLKEMCEVVITENLTLKNCAELLEFSSLYNAEQLKLSCLQFMVLNLSSLLETRALDVLSEEVLLDLSTAYRGMIPAMQKRIITPFHGAPDLSVYGEEDLEEEEEEEESCREILLKKAKIKVKKKPRRRSDSSGGHTLSDIINSPPTTGGHTLSDIINSPPTAGGHTLCDIITNPPAAVSQSLLKSKKTNSCESLQELLTSDSEGSGLGPGSPRDLHSPLFSTRAELQEDKSFSQRLKTPPSTPTTHSLKTPPSTPTSQRSSLSAPPTSAARTIPKVVPCPGRAAPPVLDLRTIMDMEAHSLQTLGATPKSPGSSIKLCARLSQKQRKMLAMASKESSLETTPTPVTPPARSSGKAWATAAQSPPSPWSFRALLEEEEQRLSRAEQTGAQRSPGGPGGPPVPPTVTPSPPAAAGRVSFRCESSDSEKVPGPWVLGAAASPPPCSLVTFASILEEEKQQEAELIRSREKALCLIQTEERAIQELLLHYRAQHNPDELVLVERSSKGPMATPTWNKH